MTKRRYNFLRLASLLMIILGILGALAGIVFGIILIVSPSLLLPGGPFPQDVRNGYNLTGASLIIGGILGGLMLAALGQYFQAFLELLEVNRLQIKGLKALLDK